MIETPTAAYTLFRHSRYAHEEPTVVLTVTQRGVVSSVPLEEISSEELFALGTALDKAAVLVASAHAKSVVCRAEQLQVSQLELEKAHLLKLQGSFSKNAYPVVVKFDEAPALVMTELARRILIFLNRKSGPYARETTAPGAIAAYAKYKRAADLSNKWWHPTTLYVKYFWKG